MLTCDDAYRFECEPGRFLESINISAVWNTRIPSADPAGLSYRYGDVLSSRPSGVRPQSSGPTKR